MNVIRFLLVLVITVIIGVFAAHNDVLVPVDFYPFEAKVEVALFLMFFGAVFVGALLAGLVCAARILHWRKLVKQKNREIEKLKKEIERLGTPKQ